MVWNVSGVEILSHFLAQAGRRGDDSPGLGDIFKYGGIILAAIVGFALLIFFVKFGKLWLQAMSSGCPVSVIEFVGMYLRKVNPQVIIDVLVATTKANIPVHIDKIQAHVLARGNVRAVVDSLIAASRANINLGFERAAAIDLAGRDVLDAVRTSVHPKVIDCPNPARGRPTVDAVSRDGIQLRIKARVTVRTNLERLVGGATEETVIARVGEGIVSAVGQAETHKHVLASPRLISREVLNSGLDAGTAFDIVSIDIADVDVGDNIGARLQTDQAEADKRIAQAAAEGRRAMAVAAEQEHSAEVMSNRAKLVLAEAEVPRAMADAFRQGNLGVFDYVRLKNVESDTRMRAQIAASEEGESDRSREQGKR